MNRPLRIMLVTIVAALMGCGNTAESARPPAQVAVVAVPVAAPSAPPVIPVAVPPGEQWLSADDVAKVRLVHPRPTHGYLLAAKVDVDEQHGAHMHSPRSGTVTSIAVTPGLRIKAGAPLLTIDTGTSGGTTTVKSPIAGEIMAIAVGQGDAITGADRGAKDATELVFVADLSQVIITTGATPAGLQIGATVTFSAPSMPGKIFQGKINWVARDGSQLRCVMDNASLILTLGLRGTLFVEREGAPGLLLPRAALVIGRSAVLVRQGSAPDGRARFVETTVTPMFDGGVGDMAVTGLSPDVEVAADASAVAGKTTDAAR